VTYIERSFPLSSIISAGACEVADDASRGKASFLFSFLFGAWSNPSSDPSSSDARAWSPFFSFLFFFYLDRDRSAFTRRMWNFVLLVPGEASSYPITVPQRAFTFFLFGNANPPLV